MYLYAFQGTAPHPKFQDYHYLLNRVATAERIKRKYKSFILSFHPKNIVFPDLEKTLVLYISYLVAILFILKNKPYSFKSYRSRAHNASLYFTVS